jgi:hypothetical protein
MIISVEKRREYFLAQILPMLELHITTESYFVQEITPVVMPSKSKSEQIEAQVLARTTA